jgi:hypothetical protein
MNPFTSTAYHRLTDSRHADMTVVISTNSEDGRHFGKRTNQITQLAELRRPIDQVTTQ